MVQCVNMDEGQKPETKESKKREWVKSFTLWQTNIAIGNGHL